MPEEIKPLAQAEAIARNAKRDEIERLVADAERSDNATLASLANLYRRLTYGY